MIIAWWMSVWESLLKRLLWPLYNSHKSKLLLTTFGPWLDLAKRVMKTAKWFDESFEDKKTFLFRHIFQWECKWAWTVKCSYKLRCARLRLLFNVTSLILATTSYYSWLIEHENIEITTSRPPFTAIFARKRTHKKFKKMDDESRNKMQKILILKQRKQ